MPGIFDYLQDPVNQGLLSLSAGLLQAGGPQRFPVSTGQALGMGMQQGLGGFNSALEAQRRNQATQAMIGLQQAQAAQSGIQQQLLLSKANSMREIAGLPPIGMPPGVP